MPRHNQTFYTGHVDGNPDWRFAAARAKSDVYQAVVATVLGQVCPTLHFTEDKWTGGPVDSEIPLGEEGVRIKELSDQAVVVDVGPVPRAMVERFLGDTAADAIIGPRPVEILGLPAD